MNNIRYDLIPVQGILEVSKVLTKKLEEHQKNEWKYGISWTEVLSTLKKHLTEFELGHDFTEEGLLHMAHVASQALILCEFYKIFPQGDDRQITPLTKNVVGVDLDDTIFDFCGEYQRRFGVKLSDYWNGDYNMSENLKKLQEDKDFWINLPVITEVPFEIDYYITARSIPVEWTQEAIQRNNLPKAPIYSLPWNVSKISTLKELGITVMIDDKYATFKECKESGIFCYLVTTDANKRYEVGHHRIKSLSELTKIK